MVDVERTDAWDDARWDALLASLEGSCIFQSAAWARHKATFGWSTRRAVAVENGRPVAAIQALAKGAPGGAVLWARGGPAGAPAHWTHALRSALAPAGFSASYLRVCSYRERSEADARVLESLGWRRPGRPLNRPLTFRLDLTLPPDVLEQGLSGNWSHNLRRGLKRSSFRRWERPDARELADVYRAMESYKGMKAQHDSPSLESLLRELGPAIRLWRADDESGRPIALRAAAVFAGGAYDLLAAAAEAARKVYASYALLWSLLLDCREAGATTYDLGGADPETAKGVFDFKKGTGARPLEYLGEWDWARPRAARALLGWAAAAKAGAP